MGWWKEIVAPDASSNDSSSHQYRRSFCICVGSERKKAPRKSVLSEVTYLPSAQKWQVLLGALVPTLVHSLSSWSKDREVFILPDWSSINSVVGWVEAKGQTSIKKKFFLIPLYPNRDSTINDLFWFLSCSTQRSLFLICELLLRTEQSRDLNIPPSKRINTKRCLDSGTMNVSYVHEYGPFPQGHINFSNDPQMTDNVYSHL